MSDSLQDGLDWLADRHDVIVASHLDPDGDSLGSSLALSLGLEQIGTRATPIIAQPLPRRLSWLPGSERVRSAPEPPDSAQSVILVECSDFERCGLAGLEQLSSFNIDHHTQNALYANVNWIDSSTAAVGQMVGELLDRLGVELTAEIATNLYVTVLTDTGSFQHSNTDAAALEFAARMVAAGAEPSVIADRCFGGYPEARVRLAAEALRTLRLEAEGRIAWMAVPRETFAKVGTRDTEDLINRAQGIGGVAVSLLLKETDDGKVRVSLRSDGSVDVAEIAAEHGGGGHPRAAGCQLEGGLDMARRLLVQAVEDRLEGRV